MRLTHFYHSDSIVVTGKKPITNFSHVGAIDVDGDKKVDNVDSMIESAREMLDAEKQLARWKEVQFKVNDWCLSYPVFIKKFTFAR